MTVKPALLGWGAGITAAGAGASVGAGAAAREETLGHLISSSWPPS